MRLTSRNLPTLEIGEHRDSTVPGLLIRIWDTGRAWAFRYSYGGKRRRVDLGPVENDKAKLGEDIERARNLARLLVAGLVRGEDPRAILKRHEAGALTVAEMCAQAIEAIPLKATTRVDYRNHLKRNIEPTLTGPAAHLTRGEIRAWGAAIKTRGGYEANRAFEVLRRCYSWAVENEVLTATPFVKLPPPFDGEKIRRRVLAPEELVRLMAALKADDSGFSNAVGLLLLTGVRKDSVDSMRLSDITGDVWTIPDTKNDLAHAVPLSRQALAIVERQRRRARAMGRSPYLFPRHRPDRRAKRHYSQVGSSYVASLRRRVGGEPWRLHDLRTTIATHLEDQLGTDLRVISLILGHVPQNVPESTRAYALGQRLADRREALQAWADWLQSLKTGPTVAQSKGKQ